MVKWDQQFRVVAVLSSPHLVQRQPLLCRNLPRSLLKLLEGNALACGVGHTAYVITKPRRYKGVDWGDANVLTPCAVASSRAPPHDNIPAFEARMNMTSTLGASSFPPTSFAWGTQIRQGGHGAQTKMSYLHNSFVPRRGCALLLILVSNQDQLVLVE